MIGSSRASLATVRETVNDRFPDPGLDRAGQDLLAVVDLLVREKPLRSSLADSGRSAVDRRLLVEKLFSDRISGLALDLLRVIVGQRWSTENDLVDAVEFAGAQSMYAASESAGELDRVEEELFRFGRVVAENGELQLTLASPALAKEAKRGVLVDLLTERVTATTVDLLVYIATHLRGRKLEAAIDYLTELAAERRGKLLATVRSARELSAEQVDRLVRVLERIYSNPVAVNVEVDPSIIGGLTVQIGDDVIDGSIANRLENARRDVAG